jgi:hypothetical protein
MGGSGTITAEKIDAKHGKEFLDKYLTANHNNLGADIGKVNTHS